MCGRYLSITDEDMEELKGIVNEVSDRFSTAGTPKGEVFPSNSIPVVYSWNGKNILSTAKWGFPSFQNKGLIINARAESAAEKPLFKSAFMSKRCLVPADGYYEWLRHPEGEKTKYLMTIKDKRMFYMAGLYSLFKDADGSAYAAAVIITTDANPDVAFIHDRMPVILPDESVRAWLDQANTDRAALQSLLLPYQTGGIRFGAA